MNAAAHPRAAKGLIGILSSLTARSREQYPVACDKTWWRRSCGAAPQAAAARRGSPGPCALTSVREDQQAGEQTDGQPEQKEHRRMVRNACSRRESGFPRPTACAFSTPSAPTRTRQMDGFT